MRWGNQRLKSRLVITLTLDLSLGSLIQNIEHREADMDSILVMLSDLDY